MNISQKMLILLTSLAAYKEGRKIFVARILTVSKKHKNALTILIHLAIRGSNILFGGYEKFWVVGC